MLWKTESELHQFNLHRFIWIFVIKNCILNCTIWIWIPHWRFNSVYVFSYSVLHRCTHAQQDWQNKMEMWPVYPFHVWDLSLKLNVEKCGFFPPFFLNFRLKSKQQNKQTFSFFWKMHPDENHFINVEKLLERWLFFHQDMKSWESIFICDDIPQIEMLT